MDSAPPPVDDLSVAGARPRQWQGDPIVTRTPDKHPSKAQMESAKADFALYRGGFSRAAGTVSDLAETRRMVPVFERRRSLAQ